MRSKKSNKPTKKKKDLFRDVLDRVVLDKVLSMTDQEMEALYPGEEVPTRWKELKEKLAAL